LKHQRKVGSRSVYSLYSQALHMGFARHIGDPGLHIMRDRWECFLRFGLSVTTGTGCWPSAPSYFMYNLARIIDIWTIGKERSHLPRPLTSGYGRRKQPPPSPGFSWLLPSFLPSCQALRFLMPFTCLRNREIWIMPHIRANLA
jgi:hypothetical protein